MKKRVLLVLLALALVVSLVTFAACAKEEEVVTEEWEWPSMIAVLVSPVASASYGTMVGWTAMLQKDSGMQIRCVPQAGEVENWTNIRTGRYLWYVNAATQVTPSLEAIGGAATTEGGPFQVRSMWPSFRSGMGHMVRGDSNIRTPEDIKPGVKIAYPSGSPMGRVLVESLLAWAEVDPNDAVWVPYSSFGQEVPMVLAGQADICFAGPTSPVVYEAEGSPHGIAWIQLDAEANPEGAKRFLEVWPTIGFGTNVEGVPSSIGLKGLLSITFYYTRAEADTDVIYYICQWLGENYEKYKDISVMAGYMDIDTLMEGLETSFVPAHDGLVKYLKEIGRWTKAHDARQKANVDLITSYIDAYTEAIITADEKGIKVDPENQEWIELWENYKKELRLPTFSMFAGLD